MTTFGGTSRNEMQGLFQQPVKGCSLCHQEEEKITGLKLYS